MYIHLGGEIVVRSIEVIAILDQQATDLSDINNSFFEYCRGLENIEVISRDMTKSIVITSNKVYFSPVSSLTLKRRSEVISELDLIAE